jgi:hypothetical protein
MVGPALAVSPFGTRLPVRTDAFAAISQVFGKTAAIVNVFQRLSIFAFSHHFRFC